MRHRILLAGLLLVLTACSRSYEQNPDPNHTHADFAVWVDGGKVDFSKGEYMSGVSYDEESHDEQHEYLHKYLHLHDEIGDVLHRHKPGLALKEFFESLSYKFDERPWRMFIRNPASDTKEWKEVPFDLSHVFADMDQVLITDTRDDELVSMQKEQMTEEACRFSRTCPWMGDPPAENCIADPAVPCVVPEDDL